jgi:2-C-methyl-D-erythritol 2,4-cyclodiphosphate synthase
VPGLPFIAGGVRLEADCGEDGHSDGDVLCHAVTDALLGAAAKSDIGELFPDSDPRYKDADSLALLKQVWDALADEGWELVNLDCVVSTERPKILPHRTAIRESLASALGADSSQIFVKGKTGEGIGEIGRGEAVEALAVCLIRARA